MEKVRIETYVEVYEHNEKLPKKDMELIKHATQALKTAYAPYSQFQVGAAVHLSNNEIVYGSNQENASFPAGICGERVALVSAITRYPKAIIESLAIITSDNTDIDPAAPCGICRQVINEFESRQGQPIRLILASRKGKTFIIQKAGSLMPIGFHSGFLGKNNEK